MLGFATNKENAQLWAFEKASICTALMASSLLVGILICFAQLCLAGRIIRAKTDVPIFNQLFVLCLIVSGFITNNATTILS